ncbi:MAG: HEAT repeat domain-containing protein [Planctomycetota bacterium]|jgi:HEAT repeat protein
MKRKTSSLLILGALAGVLATAVLVAKLMGVSTGSGRLGPGTKVWLETPERDARRTPDAVIRVDPRRSGRIDGGGIRPSGALSGGNAREPYDGPRTAAEIAKAADEILSLLRAIPDEDDRSKRQDLYRQLQKLVRGLGHHVPQAYKDELLSMLSTVDPQWRMLVGETLGYLRGDAETAGQLVKMLRGRPDNQRTRRAILLALGNMNVKEVVPELLKTLRTGHDDEEAIVGAIGKIGGETADQGLADMLGKLLKSNTRRAIERVLGEQRNPALMEQFERGLADADVQTRLSYVKVLGASRDPKYAEGIRDLLAKETDPQVRKSIIRALGQFGDPASGEKLLELIEHGTQRDRADATNAINRVKDSATVNKLADSWGRLGPDAQRAVMMAGSRVTQPSDKLLDLAKENLKNDSLRMRTYSARMLGRRGRDDAVDPLVGYLRVSTQSSEQTAALRALLDIRTKRAAEEALASLYVVSNEQRRKSYEAQFSKILESKIRNQ